MAKEDDIQLEENIELNVSTKKKLKENDVKKSDLEIKFNKWGFLFLFLCIGIIGYFIISPIVFIPPFKYDVIKGEYIIDDLLITILGVLALIFLGLGIYFGYYRKPKGALTGEETTNTSDEKDSITVVYIEDDQKLENGEDSHND